MRPLLRCSPVYALFILLASCGGPKTLPPVEDLGTVRGQQQVRFWVVKAGDTLYSIAWSIGRDHRQLARWNRIKSPYLIKPGQRIRLTPPGKKSSPRRPAARVRAHTVRRGDTLYSIGKKYGISAKRLARINRIPPPYLIKPGQRLKLASSAKARKRTPSKRRTTRKSAARLPRKVRRGKWAWPVRGKITRRFGQQRSKGIDIAGRRGQAIYATAAGRVVYSGRSLPEYGKLVIIKHNADFLSAYAHIAGTYVKEGDMIKKGQKIAAMGNSGTDSVKLHFEIRYQGTPVNPLRLLPN